MTEPPQPCVICNTRPPITGSLCCGGCYARIRGDLATTAWAYVHLGNTMRALRAAHRESTRQHGGESRPPLAVELVDARAVVRETVTLWGRHIAEHHEPALRGPLDWDVVSVARWMLTETLPWVSGQWDAPDFADDLAAARRAAYTAAPWERVRTDLSATCPGCGMLSLSTYPGDVVAVCRNRGCGRQVRIASMKETVRWTRKAAAA